MKSFKEYLIESLEEKKYVFKVKLAGDLPEHIEDTMKAALEKYKVSSFSKGKTTPIQAKLLDFPTLENTNMTIFDVELEYPTTSQVLTSYIAEHTGIQACCIKVRSLKEEEEAELNSANLEETDKEALLNQDYQKENNQHLVGEKQISNLLKELAKASKENQPKQYKGINDKILAKSAPKEKAVSIEKVGPAKSVLQPLTKTPTAKKGK